MSAVDGPILVAIDLSDESSQVIERAVAMRGDRAMHLVHVVRPIEHVYGGFGAVGLAGDFTAQMATLEQQASEQARAGLATHADQLGLDVSATHVLIGNPADEIHRLADETGAGVIVLGSHGRHGLGLLLGSTANAVLHGARCDVYAVRVALND